MTIRDWSEEFYKEIFQLAWLASLPILKDREAAEDVAAETVVKFFESEKSGEKILNPLGWVRRAGVRKALNDLQKKKPDPIEEGVAEFTLTASNPLEVRESDEEIDRLIARLLTPAEKKVFNLYEQGYSDEEIALQLHKGVRPVADLRRSARKKLRDALGFPPRFPSQPPDSDE